MGITVYGSSDDLIEVEGNLKAEFDACPDENYLAFSNGVVLSIVYGEHGVWRIVPLANVNNVTVEYAPVDDENNYSDKAILHQDANWVVHGVGFAHKNIRSF